MKFPNPKDLGSQITLFLLVLFAAIALNGCGRSNANSGSLTLTGIVVDQVQSLSIVQFSAAAYAGMDVECSTLRAPITSYSGTVSEEGVLSLEGLDSETAVNCSFYDDSNNLVDTVHFD